MPRREGEKESRELATSEMTANFPRRRILGHDNHLPAVLVTVLWRSGVLRLCVSRRSARDMLSSAFAPSIISKSIVSKNNGFYPPTAGTQENRSTARGAGPEALRSRSHAPVLRLGQAPCFGSKSVSCFCPIYFTIPIFPAE